MKRLLLLLALTVFAVQGYSQPSRFYFDRLDINDGLSQNTVHAILQDSRGFMWFGTKDGLNRYDGQSFRVFRNVPGQDGCIGNSYIICLVESPDGRIWIGTDGGLYIYDPAMESFRHVLLYGAGGELIEKPVYLLDCDRDGYVWIACEDSYLLYFDPSTQEIVPLEHLSHHGNVRSLKSDREGNVWITWYGGGLFWSEDKLQTIKPFISSAGQIIFNEDAISGICFHDYNMMYIGLEENGVAEINLVTSEVRKLPLSDRPLYVRDLLRYSDDEVWIGSEAGIFIYNTRTREITNLRSSVSDPFSLSDNAIHSLGCDAEGGIWIGSYFGGLNYLPRRNANFDKYYSTQGKGLGGLRVREICRANDGNLWIGTEDAGLYKFDPRTKEFSFFAPSRNFTNIHGLCMDGDELWISTFSTGIYVYNTKTGSLKNHVKENRAGSLHNNYVFTLCRASSGQIFLGTVFGLHYYDKATGAFVDVPEVTNGKMVNDIREDSSGNLWVATNSNGIYRYNMKNRAWSHFVHTDSPQSLPKNKILSIFEDSNRQVWLTTEGAGFCRFDPVAETFTRYDSSNDIPGNVALQIIEDGKGMFWIATNQGLAKFDPRTGTVHKTYTVGNGLLSNQFNYKSGYRSEQGDIYFGCIEGLISFNPDTIADNEFVPPVYITDFALLNGDADIGAEGSPLRQSIMFTDHVRLKHNQNSISLRIAALSYQASRMNKLLYKLEGIDSDWRTYESGSAITYSHIDYGKHLFRVKGSNADGMWNGRERRLLVEIMPPFHLSKSAYAVYIILFISLTLLLIRYRIRRSELKQQRQIQVFEHEKEREVHESKISFFTNVAHEIRTPLTLIKGPLDSILSKNRVDGEVAEDLCIMKQNTDRLLDLTNQLLDFRKTEKEGFSLSIGEYNVADIVEATFNRFKSMAKEKNIEFALDIADKNLHARVDKEAFIKILSNLLNNALKYSNRFIRMVLGASGNDFIVKVMNDGDAVPDEMREKIFQPFFRYTRDNGFTIPGTGIGLPLARSLAELHGGTLKMDADTRLNMFMLTMPAGNSSHAATLPQEITDETYVPADCEENDAGMRVILVVEDNLEMLAFIKRQLAVTYSVLTAENGNEALKILSKRYVDLIVSDVMMPDMDGFELCRKVKVDIDLSHIPLVLLTAKANVQSKVEGMETGADAYIEKPFSPEYLLAVIANLINSREKLREAFTKHPLVIAGTVAATSADMEFLAKLQDIIHANFSNPEFTMEEIAETMNMSRSSFYRKIKGVLDMTPNDYLRLERLKASAQLLKENKYQINEVCYMVGFNSASYFAKCFHKQFGVLPKEFINDNN